MWHSVYARQLWIQSYKGAVPFKRVLRLAYVLFHARAYALLC